MKKDGLLYTDNDTDKVFVNRFKILLKLFRSIICNPKKEYRKTNKTISEELFKLAEIHYENGIDSKAIIAMLKEIGFMDVNWHFHWFGVFNIFNRLIKHRTFNAGFAPTLCVEAKKRN